MKKCLLEHFPISENLKTHSFKKQSLLAFTHYLCTDISTCLQMKFLPQVIPMKLKISVFLFVFIVIANSLFAQEKTKKQIKEEQRQELKAHIDTVLNSKTFNFSPGTAAAQGFRPVGISSEHNYVKFRPDFIESKLPFYGQTYGSIAFGGDEGLSFSGIPDNYTITNKKKNFRINAVVNSDVNVYKLILTVRFNGKATLSVSSNNRSPVTFEGWIMEEETAVEKP
jgi:hypothetical protein